MNSYTQSNDLLIHRVFARSCALNEPAPRPVNHLEQLRQTQQSQNIFQQKRTVNEKSTKLIFGPLATADVNWQTQKATVRDRNAAMFNNELMSDVHFVVGMKEVSERIPAHKYVLTTGSPVFYAMFYGGLAGDNGADIEIPDVEPIAFCTLLKYIYCDMIDLNTDNVLATLYAAKKYIIPHLARACVTFVETSLTTHNACLLLSQSKLFEEPELMHRCWEVIDAQTSMAIASDGFTDIDFETLMSLLGRETLNVKELDLFEAAIKWGEVKCIRNDMEPTAKNKRKVLGDALNLIRIPAMKLEEFANGVAQSGILTSQETTEIFLNYTASNFSAKFTLFSSKPRKGFNGKGVQGGHIAD